MDGKEERRKSSPQEPATAAYLGHEHVCAASLVSISTGTPYMYCSTGVSVSQ